MTSLTSSKTFRLLRTVLFLWVLPMLVWAGPGAHGPNGEHLELQPTGSMGARQLTPRVETHSDLFELVGTLTIGEFSIFIDRYATNEPVLKAQVEVESEGLKAQATFNADMGHYTLDDPALLKKLNEPGEHALVITVLTGSDSDLLDGLLRVPLPQSAQDHGVHWSGWAWGALLAAMLLGLLGLRLQRWRRRSFSTGSHS